jgi:D-beta-D-heptose 7-phosphate kinase/D-beta-D-heptose 1-phosphate adenosyltransferase
MDREDNVGRETAGRLSRLRRVVDRFVGAKVVVVGDLMVDRYYWGAVKRISPEAPVPVVEVTQETKRLGGAANVAHNIRTLGGEPMLCGVAGRDPAGEWLVAELERIGVDGSGVILADGLPTTIKSRVVAHSQQVVRFDREKRDDLEPETARELERALGRRWKDARGAVVSDYAKGVVGEGLMDMIRRINRGARRIPVAVDPKSEFFKKYRRVSVITPNYGEAVVASGLGTKGSGGTERIGSRLLSLTGAGAILITRGEEGMSLFEKGRKPFHIPTVAREVYDVTGAGDTVLGTLMLALAAGASIRDAALLANVAAGVVVGEVGTVPATRDQLLLHLS